MTKSKTNLVFVSTLLFALIPGLDKAIKRQMLSFISLMISCMCILTPLAPVASAAEPVSYSVFKTVSDVAGEGPTGNVTAAGDIITYQINVNNTAGVPLTNVTVNDPMIGIINNVTDLGIGNNETLSGNYTVTQEDINNNGNGTGFIINNVTVVCDQNTTVNNATATVPITSCTITKTVTNVTGNGNGNITVAGDVISYQINVNNTAGIPLTNVTVTDPMLGSLLNVTDLGIGSNETLFGNYTVTQADIDNYGNGTGFIINNATVDSDQLGPKNATAQVPIDPYYSIEKIVTDVGGQGPGGNVTVTGDIITYQINVTNSGRMDLNNVTVTDPLIGNTTGPSSSINNDTILNVGEMWTYTGNYTVTRADITNYGNGTGFIINNATVDCDQLGPKNSTVQVPIATAASIDGIVTDVAGQGPGGNVTDVGDIITYQVNVTNNGITDLTNVTVNDTLTGLMGPTSSINNDTVLNPGETWTYSGNYTVTQDDINNNGNVVGGSSDSASSFEELIGKLINGTQAPETNDVSFGELIGELINGTQAPETSGNGFIEDIITFDSDQLGPKDASIQVPIEKNPHYSISKSVISPDDSGDCIVNSPGDDIPYRIVVKNDGNVDLTGVSVSDPMINLTGPTGDENDQGVLNPGEIWVYNGVYLLTQDDINNGNTIDNTATVSSNELPEESSDVSQPIEQNVDLSIQKSLTGIDEVGDFMINQPGDVINYRIAVDNSGDVDLHNVHVADSLIDSLSGPTGDSVNSGVLNPGETWVYEGDYTVTQADIESNGGGTGFITNTATVHCSEHSSESSSIDVPIIPVSNFGTDPVPGSELEADFTANPESGYAPLSVQFTDKSQNAETWSWDFNDDGTAESTVQNPPAYTYTTPGTYVAKLTVSNASGSDSKPVTITVLQATTSSNNGGSSGKSSGGSIGSVNVVGSSSTANTHAVSNVTQPANNTSNIEQKPANVEQTPGKKAASTPAKQRKTPGFEIVFGITALFGAVYLCRRR
ncbi:MAG: trimeric autotransporter adhesin [Euryarchaeota archaeon]|nr:trimeric autotransporter adhesin [Euryarchaeota archaeon]